MRGVNKAIILGRLGNDPEVRNFSNGNSVTNISVATSEKWTDKQTGEPREATEWHRIALFNRLGEIAAQYLRKGSQVYIEGKIQTRKWQDQNGQDRYTTEIRADNLQMLGGGQSGGQSMQVDSYNNSGNANSYSANNHQNDGYQNNQNQVYNNQNTLNNQSNMNNQNSFGQNNQPQPQKPEFNNQTTPASTMADTPTDDDIPF